MPLHLTLLRPECGRPGLCRSRSHIWPRSGPGQPGLSLGQLALGNAPRPFPSPSSLQSQQPRQVGGGCDLTGLLMGFQGTLSLPSFLVLPHLSLCNHLFLGLSLPDLQLLEDRSTKASVQWAECANGTRSPVGRGMCPDGSGPLGTGPQVGLWLDPLPLAFPAGVNQTGFLLTTFQETDQEPMVPRSSFTWMD